MSSGKVESINVSDGGVPKHGVVSARITSAGVENDRQRDRRHHGGPDRAVCIYPLELIQALQREGHPIVAGSAGENVTVSGLNWDSIAPGMRLSVGTVQLEVTSYTSPCKTIRESFLGGQFERISQKTNPGWSRVYARVVADGIARIGDLVVVDDTDTGTVPAPCGSTGSMPSVS